MYIDRVLAPIETLGPGKRLVIWTRGCSKHCVGCANPELWDTSGARNYSVTEIFKIIVGIYRENPFDGVTISGGDPLEQIEEILELVEQIKEITPDIIVYTGYYFEELSSRYDMSYIERLKKSIAVLIDGPYIEQLNTDGLALRGSSNQNIIFFDGSLKEKYESYLRQGRKIQNVYMGDKLISVGIHNRKGE